MGARRGRPRLLPCRAAWAGTRREALAPLGGTAVVADSVDRLVQHVVAASKPGDHVLVMSNGGFGGIHGKLLDALRARA